MNISFFNVIAILYKAEYRMISRMVWMLVKTSLAEAMTKQK